jgi:hypothetical protein
MKGLVGIGLGLAFAALWVAAYLDTPVSYIVLQRDTPPYNVTARSSLGNECVTPCSFPVYTREPFSVTLHDETYWYEIPPDHKHTHRPIPISARAAPR